jgi:hypothetical protein
MVRQYGVENWSHERGRHYLWQKPEEPRIEDA